MGGVLGYAQKMDKAENASWHWLGIRPKHNFIAVAKNRLDRISEGQ
jgi:hypothetical protein